MLTSAGSHAPLHFCTAVHAHIDALRWKPDGLVLSTCSGIVRKHKALLGKVNSKAKCPVWDNVAWLAALNAVLRLVPT